jgi:uncharacterized SAM-dependent methyltransferase
VESVTKNWQLEVLFNNIKFSSYQKKLCHIKKFCQAKAYPFFALSFIGNFRQPNVNSFFFELANPKPE